MANGPSDQELLQAVQRRDIGAFEQFYDHYGTLVYSLAVKVLEDRILAEDVVQEVFLNLWRNAGKFDSSKGAVRNWLLACTSNRAIDFLRQRQGKTRLDVALDETAYMLTSPDPWGEVVANADSALLSSAMKELPEEQRQTLEMAYFQGMTHSEIADGMAVPLGTVKGRLRLALEKMRVYLESKGIGSGL